MKEGKKERKKEKSINEKDRYENERNKKIKANIKWKKM